MHLAYLPVACDTPLEVSSPCSATGSIGLAQAHPGVTAALCLIAAAVVGYIALRLSSVRQAKKPPFSLATAWPWALWLLGAIGVGISLYQLLINPLVRVCHDPCPPAPKGYMTCM